MPVESGYSGQLISLAGVAGRPGLGRHVTSYAGYGGVGTPTQVSPNNPMRISALIRNVGPGASTIYLDTVTACVLQVGGTLQIDQNLPWTGAISASGTGADLVSVMEISVQ